LRLPRLTGLGVFLAAMHALGGFEETFTRRLRAELDAVDVRVPVRTTPGRRLAAGRFWIARPLAVALIAAIALGVLAASVTRSPDPGRWIQPGVWMRALGVAPPPSPEATQTAAPSPSPSDKLEPTQSPEPESTARPGSPESEPSERPSSPGARESPDTEPGDG